MNRISIYDNVPYFETIQKVAPETITDGGSCISTPDGSWIIESIVGKETFVAATIDLEEVYKERHNFNPSDHYSRPDVMQLKVNRERQKIVAFTDQE